MEDLFGNEVSDVPLSADTSRRVSNDMEQVRKVAQRAVDGTTYLVSAKSKVYELADPNRMRPVPLWEAGVVLQLLDGGMFTRAGKVKTMLCGAARISVTWVGVPLSTKKTLSRWAALRVPQTWAAAADQKGA
ncbi:hypothetical protein [Saccharothrix longispora]|uniref:hypothetical protein n=1 Tax=Saccharothrix longispora TaxID=33920 RepID=UPI0028FD7155|nr:hypothetical protein [Saccharothrix longispora]MDU0290726.1 hypothetical protein [Saccharothrix longispora]